MKVQNLKKIFLSYQFSSAISQSRNLSFTMILVVKKQIQWFNLNMKNLASSVRKKLVEKYTVQDKSSDLPKRTDINILLNRVKLNQKNESRKKIYFSAAASAGLFLFGLIIF